MHIYTIKQQIPTATQITSVVKYGLPDVYQNDSILYNESSLYMTDYHSNIHWLYMSTVYLLLLTVDFPASIFFVIFLAELNVFDL